MLAMAFSSDGRYLLTGGESRLGTASGICRHPRASSIGAGRHVLGPGGAGGRSPAPRSGPGTPNRWSPATATARSTSGHGTPNRPRVLDPRRLVVRQFTTAVKSLCFTSDGRYLAAAGDGKRIWVGAMEPRPHRVDLLDRLGPHHDEQINALIAWRARSGRSADPGQRQRRHHDPPLGPPEGGAAGDVLGGEPPGRCRRRRAAHPGAGLGTLHARGRFDASAEATKLVALSAPGRPVRAVGGPRPWPRCRAIGGRHPADSTRPGSSTSSPRRTNVYGLGEDLCGAKISRPEGEVR